MCFLPAVSFPGQDWCDGKKATAVRRKLETGFLPRLLPAAAPRHRRPADRLAHSPTPGNRYFYEPAFIFQTSMSGPRASEWVGGGAIRPVDYWGGESPRGGGSDNRGTPPPRSQASLTRILQYRLSYQSSMVAIGLVAGMSVAGSCMKPDHVCGWKLYVARPCL